MPPGKPPFPVPNGGQGNDWKWNPNPKYDPLNPSSRPGSFGPKQPIPEQSQPRASWDDNTPEPHWDLDDGLKNRTHWDKDGNPLTPEQAHGRCPKVPWWLRLPKLLPPIIIAPNPDIFYPGWRGGKQTPMA